MPELSFQRCQTTLWDWRYPALSDHRRHHNHHVELALPPTPQEAGGVELAPLPTPRSAGECSWSNAWMHFALPEGFAAVLAEGPQLVDHLQFLRTLWDAATFAESVHGAGHPSAAGVCALREEIYWLDWPIAQWLLRLMAHFSWLPHAVILQFLLKFFLRLADTLCVEESHRVGRGMEQHEQQPDALNLLSFFSRL